MEVDWQTEEFRGRCAPCKHDVDPADVRSRTGYRKSKVRRFEDPLQVWDDGVDRWLCFDARAGDCANVSAGI